VIHKTLQELQVPHNPFSVVLQVVRTSLEKRNWEDTAQLTWKKEVVTALREANYSTPKIRRMLQFISFYVSFKQEDTLIELNEHIETTFKARKSMGIEEIIKEELKRQRRVLLRKAVRKGLQQGVQQGLQQGLQQGVQQGKMETIITGIQRMLQQGKYSLSEIAEIFNVSTDFIKQIEDGKIKSSSF
jgi:flagellar biosynthesis/type III secretory pathway protein FliH